MFPCDPFFHPLKFLISDHSKGGIVLQSRKQEPGGIYLTVVCSLYPLMIMNNHNIDERGNLFSLPANYELSRGESNPRLPELSVIYECHILGTAQYDRLQKALSSTERPMNKQQL